MPMYLWVCERCQCQVSLLRSFDHYKRAPEDKELGEAAACPAGGSHQWARDWTHGVPKFVRSPGWGDGSKGNW